MFGAPPARLPQPITLFLLPKVSMMGLASAIEPLRSANRMSGRALYTWHILSKDGEPVTASNGIPVLPEAGIDTVERCETLILCGGLDVHLYRDKAVFGWLRRLDRQGAPIPARFRPEAMRWRAPTRHYLEIRLARARLLLQQTDLSVLDVALACGFVSASHFSKCYREFFGKKPREERMTSVPLRHGKPQPAAARE